LLIANYYRRISLRNNFRIEWVVNQCTPSPASSNLICTVGTNSGVLQLTTKEDIRWLTPKDADWAGRTEPREIFDQDYLVNNHNVLLAGGRQGCLFLMDLRVPHTEWETIRHQSSITHLKSINHHHIAVSGLESTMAIYDIRHRRKLPNGTTPILKFPEYRNQAHVHIGWDVNVETGLVAAAHDDGTVGMYSLRTGTRLRSPAIDTIRLATPIKSLMFQTMPRQHNPSLFIGMGAALHKYSFGVSNEEDEA
jgi:WD40 repeat protein